MAAPCNVLVRRVSRDFATAWSRVHISGDCLRNTETSITSTGPEYMSYRSISARQSVKKIPQQLNWRVFTYADISVYSQFMVATT